MAKREENWPIEEDPDDQVYAFEITPHPYSTELDTMVTDDGAEAVQAAKDAAEGSVDELEAGEKTVITIVRNF